MSTSGERFRKILEETGVTQSAMAKVARVAPASINKILKGINNPSDQTIELVAKHYGYNVEWLASGTGEPKPQLEDDAKLAAFFADILRSQPKSIQRRWAAAFSELTVEEWEIIANLCEKLSKEKEK